MVTERRSQASTPGQGVDGQVLTPLLYDVTSLNSFKRDVTALSTLFTIPRLLGTSGQPSFNLYTEEILISFSALQMVTSKHYLLGKYLQGSPKDCALNLS